MVLTRATSDIRGLVAAGGVCVAVGVAGDVPGGTEHIHVRLLEGEEPFAWRQLGDLRLGGATTGDELGRVEPLGEGCGERWRGDIGIGAPTWNPALVAASDVADRNRVGKPMAAAAITMGTTNRRRGRVLNAEPGR